MRGGGRRTERSAVRVFGCSPERKGLVLRASTLDLVLEDPVPLSEEADHLLALLAGRKATKPCNQCGLQLGESTLELLS